LLEHVTAEPMRCLPAIFAQFPRRTGIHPGAGHIVSGTGNMAMFSKSRLGRNVYGQLFCMGRMPRNGFVLAGA